MSQIAGIDTRRDVLGNITHITIDVKAHEEMVAPILEQLRVIEKSSFRKEFEAGISIEDSQKKAHDKIDSLWKK